MDIDVSQQFKEQLKKVRVFAILFFLVLMGAIGAALAVALTTGEQSHVLYILLGMVVIMAFLVPPLIRATKCPNCSKYLGRTFGPHCHSCGAKIK